MTWLLRYCKLKKGCYMTTSVGIDVSKRTLDIVVLIDDSAKHRKVSNSHTGWKQFDGWLRELDATDAHICMESTGVYAQGVSEYFHALGYTVSVVNPARTKAFGDSLLSRNKTDKGDAHIIALFCERMKPAAWQPLVDEVAHLRSLTRMAANLEGDRTRCISRLESTPEDSPVRYLIDEQLAVVTRQQAEVEAEIQRIIRESASLRAKQDLLCSIVGIGAKTAAVLLSELPDVERFTTSREFIAFAGLSPQEKKSGTSVRGRTKMSKMGVTRVRSALYYPAVTAIRCNPHLKPFAERLRERGKHNMAVIGAVMRKLLVLIYAILKSGTPYDREYGFAA